ncbi:hypothetical protein MNBD_GAMMA03-2013 [hydrothermal vent metagenome]|uniref:Uncharacterized protein n=1 Tax=hydrothermal vent metagenome TaxID=652676 RepID=A0A3B0WRJ6_9ZZZZ
MNPLDSPLKTDLEKELQKEPVPERIPTPQEMLSQLQNINPNDFNIKAIANDLKGNKVWISILTLPVSAIILASFTLLGAFLFDSPIISFFVTAALLFWIGKLFDNQQKIYTIAARQEVMNRISAIEEGFGLLPHFKPFLPQKYRHLWQSIKRGNYIYIEQYIQAILLLQKKLDSEKFIAIWYLTYPEIDPDSKEYIEAGA